MSFLTHMLKQHKNYVIAILGALILIAIYLSSQSQASFAPGTELDPNCEPGDVGCTVDAGSSQWQDSAPDIYFDAGNVLIGTSGTPSEELEVNKQQDGGTVISVGNSDTTGTDAVAGFFAGSDVASLAITSFSSTYSSPAFPDVAGDTGMFAVVGDLHLGSSTDIVFSTSLPFVERMRLTSTGNLGIGTTVPASLVNVEGPNGTNFQLDDTLSNPYLQWTNDSGGFANSYIFVDNAQLDLALLGGTMGFSMATSGGNSLTLNTPNLQFLMNDSTNAFSLTGSSSPNVGIGTTSPESTLQIGVPDDSAYRYMQLDFDDSAPPVADCDDPGTEVGRMALAGEGASLYICSSTGWSVIAL